MSAAQPASTGAFERARDPIGRRCLREYGQGMIENTRKRGAWVLIGSFGLGIAILGLLGVVVGMFTSSTDFARFVSDIGWGALIVGVVGMGVSFMLSW